MAFQIYKRTLTGTGCHFERMEPVRLASPAGLIARHVKNLPAEKAAAGWALEGDELPRLAGVAWGKHGEYVVLMDLAAGETAAVCLYQLLRVHGVTQGTSTHLSLDFDVLVDGPVPLPPSEFKAAFNVPSSKPLKNLRETLQLSGGLEGGDWKWAQSAMNIGATVVHPSPVEVCASHLA